MASETKKKEHSEAKPLEKMTVKELRAMAMEIPHSVSVHDLKKEELVALIRQSKGPEDEDVKKKEKKEKKEKKTGVKIVKTKKQLKATIRELKNLRIEAQKKHDKKSTDQLRRRIGHLKKMTRRIAAG